MNYPTSTPCSARSASSHISAHTVAQQLAGRLADEVEDRDDPAAAGGRGAGGAPSEAVVVEGSDDVWVTLARCCTPVPGDDDPRVS